MSKKAKRGSRYSANPEMIEKMRARSGQRTPWCEERVICIDTGVIYNSMVEAERILGLPHNYVSKQIRGKIVNLTLTFKKYTDGMENKNSTKDNKQYYQGDYKFP